MYYQRQVGAAAPTRAVVVHQECYPDLTVAVHDDLVVDVDTSRSTPNHRPFRLPSHRSRGAEVSDSQLEFSSTIGDVAGLVVPSVEYACSVGGYAEIAVGDVD